MRKNILFCLFVFCVSNSIAQNGKNYFFNEFTLSVNSSNVKDRFTDDRIGFGIGAFHYSEISSAVNFIAGLELNNTSQFKYYEYDGHFSSYKDVNYHFYHLSLRAFPRFIAGNNIKFFFDIGPQLDIPVYGYRSGYHSSFNTATYTYTYEKESRMFSNGFNLLGCLCIGALKSIGTTSLLLKCEYKIGSTDKYDMIEIRNQYVYFTLGLRKNKNK